MSTLLCRLLGHREHPFARPMIKAALPNRLATVICTRCGEPVRRERT